MVPVTEKYTIRRRNFKATLGGGLLRVETGSEWDFATGAVDTPDMVVASLLHDTYCNMYEAGIIPFSLQREGDRLFREILKERGCSWFRRWYSYAAVSVSSYVRKII